MKHRIPSPSFSFCKIPLRTVLGLFLSLSLVQADEIFWDVQVYPAGIIAGPSFILPLSERARWGMRFAYNATDRQDFGEHDDEQGGGFGAGTFYRHSLGDVGGPWFYGLRLDAWQLDIDWREGGSKGQTEVTVIQPTAELGYLWELQAGWLLNATISIGAEINSHTAGEDVGEGAIVLGGLSVGRKL